MLRRRSALVALVVAAACSGERATSTDRVNPFLEPSTLPYQAPPFDRITDADYQPGIEAGMAEQRAQVDSIARQQGAPTFDNTLLAMEKSGQILTRVMRAFSGVTSANTDSVLQAVQSEMVPRLAAHSDAIRLDASLFGRVKTLYDGRDALGLDSAQIFLVERYYKDFVRAGAQLAEADQTELRALNEEGSKLATRFQNELLAGRNAAAVVVSDSAELAGLSDQDLSAAADEARARGLAGQWVLALQNTSQQPVAASLRNRALRERVMRASLARGDSGEHDTRPLVRRLAQLRARKAQILGYPTWAAHVLDDQMAKTPAAAEKLLTDMVPAATAKARSEAARMQAIVDQEGGGFRLASWD